MANKELLFQGIREVSMTTFTAMKEKGQLGGWIWFVRGTDEDYIYLGDYLYSKVAAGEGYATKEYVDKQIAAANKKIKAISGATNEVRTIVDGLVSDLDGVKKTAEDAKTEASAATATANTAKSTATQAKNAATSAQTTANEAKSGATAAQSTANSALTAANTAKNTATQAKNAATSAQTTANEAKNTADEALQKAKEALSAATDSVKEVKYTPIVTEGKQIGTISVDGTEYQVYAPEASESGSTVDYRDATTGKTQVKIGEIVIDGEVKDVNSIDYSSEIESLEEEISKVSEDLSGLSEDVSQVITDLNAEVERATAAEEANANAIEEEKTRAEGKEGELETAVSNEETRAKEAESDLQDAIDEVKEEVRQSKVEAGNGIEVESGESGTTISTTIPSDLVVTKSVGYITTGTTFEAGTNWQDILMAMLCQEEWGSPTNPSYTFNHTVSAPTVNLSKSGKVQVGTEVTASAKANSTSTSQKVEVKTYTYGYSTDGATKTSSNTSYTESVTPTKSGEATLSCSFSNLVNADGSAIANNAGESTTAYVKQGTCTYSVSETGQTCTPVNFNEVSVYNVSNLGNVRDTDVKTIDADYFNTPFTPTNGGSKTITGVWGYFMGSNTTVKEINEETIKSLVWSADKPTTGSTNANDIQFVIAVPDTTYTKIKVIDDNGLSWGTPEMTQLDIKAENNMEDGNGNVVKHTYNVFHIENAAGKSAAIGITITLEK